eukprot:m.44941 g.44941  ORF g.44941 m.44941 type:complete len:91 (-) comp17334_c0_seq1:187-459(-)
MHPRLVVLVLWMNLVAKASGIVQIYFSQDQCHGNRHARVRSFPPVSAAVNKRHSARVISKSLLNVRIVLMSALLVVFLVSFFISLSSIFI